MLSEQFERPEQQGEAATLGMWVFLATEVLFLGGLFAAYTVGRVLEHPLLVLSLSDYRSRIRIPPPW